MKRGIHSGLTIEQYLALDAVSRSNLCLLGTRTPAHLRAHLDGEKKKPTKALRMGSIIDTAVFEPENLDASVHIRPEFCKTAKGCSIAWDLKTNDAQSWISAHQDKPIATATELMGALEIAANVRSHPAAKQALATKGQAQQTILVPAKELVSVPDDCEVMVKIRPDWLSGEAICDLKSTVDGSKEEFAKSIYNYGYDVQAALYLDVCNAVGLEKKYFVFICCEKEPPYAVSVYRLDGPEDLALMDEPKPPMSSIEKGRMKYRYWLAQYCECVRTGEWPGYPTTIEVIKLSDWALRRAA